jgi:4,5-dihydroxyphthalate decarboxylase
MPSPVKIKFASRTYDGLLPILRGQMQLPGFDLAITETENVPAMFAGMFKGEYDISEMSLGELVYYTSRDQADFVAIPVFPSRMFRHGFIFCRKASGIKNPAELSGKKIGFPRWVQTAAIWIRGTLVDEFGVSPKDTQWYVISMHHWEDAEHQSELQPRDGSAIQWLQSNGQETSERVCRALFDGELDGIGVTEAQLPFLATNPEVKRLFENPQEVEANYFRKTKILPIMHVTTLRKELTERYPELPAALLGSWRNQNAGRNTGAARFPASLKPGRIKPSTRNKSSLPPIRGPMGWRPTVMCSINFFFIAMRRESAREISRRKSCSMPVP